MTNKYVVPMFVLMCSNTLVSCTPQYLTGEALSAYVLDEDNDLTKEREYKDNIVKVTYRPADLLIAQELGGEIARDTMELSRLKKKYADHYYFVLSLSKNEKEALYQAEGGFDQFSDLVQTLSFRMAEYVNMTTSGQDTIQVADYVYPRTYGMGGATNLMFVFAKEKTKEKAWVQFNMKEFGMGLGNQNFRFRVEDLESVPKIDFKIIEKRDL